MPPSHHNDIPPYRLFVILFAFGWGCSASKVSHGPDKDSGEPTLSDDSGDIVDLVVFDQWTALSDTDDPYPMHREASHSCDPDGILPEEGVLEVNTNDCDYAILGQPIRAEIREGDWVELMMYHSALSAIDEPAEAHFSLWVGDHIYWERTIAIPAAPEIYPVPIQVGWSAEEGTVARIHLHNHGGNSWRVAYLKRLRGDAAQELETR